MNNMKMGSERYRKALRRWNTLNWLDNPTERQRAERERLEAELSAAELADDTPFFETESGIFQKKSRIVSYSSEEVKNLPSESDWAAADAMTDEDIRAAIASDPEEAALGDDWKERGTVIRYVNGKTELAAADSPFALIADDYGEVLAREAGNVGQVEW